MANPWFRMYAEFASDPKVQMLSETNQRRLLMLFCLRCNELVTLLDEEVTFLLRISYEEWMITKSIFVDRGFIDTNNKVLNWDKRQYSSDTSKNRVAAYRERKKQESNVTVTLQEQNSNAIEQIQNRTDTDKSIVINDVADCPHQEIINLYSKNLPMLTQVRDWTDKRSKLLKARWREKKERQNLEWWDRFFSYVASSDFLTGKSKDWQADIEWLLNSSNMIKVIEGKYENKAAA